MCNLLVLETEKIQLHKNKKINTQIPEFLKAQEFNLNRTVDANLICLLGEL